MRQKKREKRENVIITILLKANENTERESHRDSQQRELAERT